jgi:pimeloyl-ACP methyl ester carboxylesterase
LPKVKVNDVEMYYEAHGEGPPLVMLHAFSLSGKMWEPFIPEYSKHFKTYLIDLPGHGKSTNPSKKFTHRQAAKDVYALLDKLGIKRFHALGNSSGAMTLIHMATQQPERIDKLVLISGTTYFPKKCREIMDYLTVDNITDAEWGYYRKIGYSDEQTKMLRQQFHDMKDSYDDMNFTPPMLSTIRAKTLIIHGDRDEFFPVSIPLGMYEAIPGSYLFVVPNFGHSLGSELGVMVDKVSEGERWLLDVKKGVALEFLMGLWDKPK